MGAARRSDVARRLQARRGREDRRRQLYAHLARRGVLTSRGAGERLIADPSAVRPRSYFASGSGRIWICTARGLEPLPPSISHGTRSPLVLQRPRPFQPAFGSSMRPSRPLAKKPRGDGMRSITICPSLRATDPSLRLAVEIGMFSPRPTVL